MSTPIDGGPAFPLPAHSGPNGEQPYPIYGMSLRDWFAGQATEHDIHQHQEWPKATYGGAATQPRYSRETARFRYADAMLTARKVMP